MYVYTTQSTKRGEHSPTRLEPFTFLIALNYLQDGPDHGVHVVVQLVDGVDRSSLFPRKDHEHRRLYNQQFREVMAWQTCDNDCKY